MRQDDADLALQYVCEATLQPDFWPEALDQIARACGAHFCTGQMIGAEGYVGLVNPGVEDVMIKFVEEGWPARNSRMVRGLALTRAGAKGLIPLQAMLSPEELARDPFQQEFARHYDIDWNAGMVLASHGDSRFIIDIQRGARIGHYSDGELSEMNRLMAKIADACSFALRLKLATATEMLDTLGARGEALALLSESGRLLHVTEACERHFAGPLTTRNGFVRGKSPNEDRQLQALIWLAANGQVSASDAPPVILRRPDGTSLVARCFPVMGRTRDMLGLARIVLAIDDTIARHPQDAAEVLRTMFGLTPAEARLAGRIGAGESLRDAADAEHVSFETARTRLKIIFLKTQTNRQAELALFVTRLTK